MDAQVAHQLARRRDLLSSKAEFASLQAHHEVTQRLQANRQVTLALNPRVRVLARVGSPDITPPAEPSFSSQPFSLEHRRR